MARFKRPNFAARCVLVAALAVLAGAGSAMAREKSRTPSSAAADPLAPSPILNPDRLRTPPAAPERAEWQNPAPQARFFTLNGILAKLNGRSLPANSVRVASVDPTDRTLTDAAPPSLLPSTRGKEPFGLFAFRAPEGDLWTKWRGLDAAMKREATLIDKCRAALSDCSPAALRFLLLAEAASAYEGHERLARVNRVVNSAVRYTTDLAQYGVIDFWATPLDTLASGRGDCEDYAIAKYAILRESGVRPEDMRLVLVRDRMRREDHAILTVLDNGEWIALDNHLEIPVKADALAHYTPLYAVDQSGVNMLAAPYADRRPAILAGDALPADGAETKLDTIFRVLGGLHLFSWMIGQPGI
jgi:predicted transglutaminase-like cysteine proteinase